MINGHAHHTEPHHTAPQRHWAEQYIGLPWQSGAQGPDAYDCWNLVRHIYLARRGINLPLFDIDATSLLSIRRAFKNTNEYGNWYAVPVDQLQELDVVLMSHALHPHHVGIWLDVDGGRMLHAVNGCGVMAQTRQQLKMHQWNLVDAIRRPLAEVGTC